MFRIQLFRCISRHHWDSVYIPDTPACPKKDAVRICEDLNMHTMQSCMVVRMAAWLRQSSRLKYLNSCRMDSDQILYANLWCLLLILVIPWLFLAPRWNFSFLVKYLYLLDGSKSIKVRVSTYPVKYLNNYLMDLPWHFVQTFAVMLPWIPVKLLTF